MFRSIRSKGLWLAMLVMVLAISSCRTSRIPKRTPVAIVPLTMDFEVVDTADYVAMFLLDQGELKPFVKWRKPARKVVAVDTVNYPGGVATGTILTTHKVKLNDTYKGVDRILRCDFTHRDVPEAFEGYRIGFITDTHYKSLFTRRELKNLVKLLKTLRLDALFLGGDYQEGCGYVDELVENLAEVKTTDGAWGVMGNNDYERCHDQIIEVMAEHGIRIMEHEMDTIRRGDDQIIVCGIRDPFNLEENGVSPTLSLKNEDFVIMLVHTPDYIEDVSVLHTDLALAGHTHGGQVRILGYAPIVPSRYGMRFLSGVKYNTAGVPMIVSNGLGTSQKNIRIGAPTDVVVVTLHALKE